MLTFSGQILKKLVLGQAPGGHRNSMEARKSTDSNIRRRTHGTSIPGSELKSDFFSPYTAATAHEGNGTTASRPARLPPAL